MLKLLEKANSKLWFFVMFVTYLLFPLFFKGDESVYNLFVAENTSIEYLCAKILHCIIGNCMPNLDDNLCFEKDLVLLLTLKYQKVHIPLLVFGKGNR